MKTLRLRCVFAAVLVFQLAALGGPVALDRLVFQSPSPAQETALDRYVHAPDSSYAFHLAKTIRGAGYEAYVLRLTSQTWKPPILPDRSVWWHWLTVVRPDRVNYHTAFLYITGGSNEDPAPDKIDPMLSKLAVTTHSIVAELRMVPNQPINFPDAARHDMVEDQFIAYTWDKFLRTGNNLWPARLPMTRSAVRAMDAVQQFMASSAGGNISVQKFVVSGASKRGWTTWTTAAVDHRVVAIVPMVIDVLNVQKSFEHHYRAYGFYSPAVKDYEDRGIMRWIGTPQYDSLMRIEDPYSYRRRFTMPKFIVNAAGDQYFLPDSSRFYFDDLPGEKHLRYITNTDHSLDHTDVWDSVAAFYDMVLRQKPRPEFAWKFEPDGSIRVNAVTTKPISVKLWQATNPLHRDFRLVAIGPAYHATTLHPQPDGTYLAKVKRPQKGWTAYFVELTFPTGGNYPLKFTTAVRVTPDTLPFPAPKPPTSPPN